MGTTLSAARIRALGKTTDINVTKVMAPQVGRDDVAAIVGYIEGTGSPIASVTPDFMGQWYADITNPVSLNFYRATGITSSDWVYNGDFGLGTVAAGVTPGTVAASKA